MLFGTIALQIVKLPALAGIGDQFPVSDPHRAVILVHPPQAVALDHLIRCKCPHEALAGSRGHGDSLPFLRLRHTREFKHGWHDVDDVGGAVPERVPCRDPSRPVRDQGRGDPAFVCPGLVAAKRGVACAGEAGAQTQISCRAARRRQRIMPAVANHDLGACSIVRGEKDEGVLKSTHRFQLRDDPADLAVHPVDHRGMDRHLGRLETPLGVREVDPRQRPVDLVRAQLLQRVRKRIGRSDRGLHRREPGGDEPHFLLPPEARLAHGVPPGKVAVAILVDVLRRRVQREVRREKGDVLEERPGCMTLGVVLQAFDGVVRDGRRRVVAFLVCRRLHRRIVDQVSSCREEVALVHHVQGSVEAAGKHLAVDVPFPAVVVSKACRLEQVRQQPRPRRTDSAPAATGHLRQGVAADLLRVVAGEQGGAGRPAARGVVELGEAKAALCQSIEIRRFDLAAITTEVRPAEVIREDDDHIGNPPLASLLIFARARAHRRFKREEGDQRENGSLETGPENGRVRFQRMPHFTTRMPRGERL